MASKQAKTAVVLSGGGSHGAYEVGVLQALCGGESPTTGYQPLKADIFTGTSVGAFNAAFMVSHDHHGQAQAADMLVQAWREQVAEDPARCGNGVYRLRGEIGDFLDPRCLLGDPLGVLARSIEDGVAITQGMGRSAWRLMQSDGLPTLQDAIEQFDLTAYVSTEPLRHLIEKNIDLDRIGRSGCNLRVISADWKEGRVKVFRNHELAAPQGQKAILASAAIPGFFPPVVVNGEILVDGGVVMNTPLMPAIEAEADAIHMLYVDPDPQHIPLAPDASMLEAVYRMLLIQFAINIKEDIATVDWINRGLEIVEKAWRNQPLAREEERFFIRVAGQFARRLGEDPPYRKITLHRYYPQTDIEGGLLGYLNFGAGRIDQLIERGRQAAREHDCLANGCLLPSQGPPSPAPAPCRRPPGPRARKGGRA